MQNIATNKFTKAAKVSLGLGLCGTVLVSAYAAVTFDPSKFLSDAEPAEAGYYEPENPLRRSCYGQNCRIANKKLLTLRQTSDTYG